ncbi:hypothetical protein [Paraburkholderia caballeronis]|uniref:hypothetical protein n=1 Tax=Paraburkholderia caballeronis TaxID=416943 RepID=UPI00115FBB43|nr:hypothetical protein [Paraburkholderia caballeronis]
MNFTPETIFPATPAGLRCFARGGRRRHSVNFAARRHSAGIALIPIHTVSPCIIGARCIFFNLIYSHRFTVTRNIRKAGEYGVLAVEYSTRADRPFC